jgi:hypothetical protein
LAAAVVPNGVARGTLQLTCDVGATISARAEFDRRRVGAAGKTDVVILLAIGAADRVENLGTFADHGRDAFTFDASFTAGAVLFFSAALCTTDITVVVHTGRTTVSVGRLSAVVVLTTFRTFGTATDGTAVGIPL